MPVFSLWPPSERFSQRFFSVMPTPVISWSKLRNPGFCERHAARPGWRIQNPRRTLRKVSSGASSGIEPREFADSDVLMPVHPYATSSCTRQLSTHEPPSPPYSAGISMFIRPVSHAFFRISRGNSPVSS